MEGEEIELNNGVAIPAIGMGTFTLYNDLEATQLAIHRALKVHFSSSSSLQYIQLNLFIFERLV